MSEVRIYLSFLKCVYSVPCFFNQSLHEDLNNLRVEIDVSLNSYHTDD